MKISLAALAGLAAAWLIPRGGGTPLDTTTPTPTPPGGLTAAAEPLAALSGGVSFRLVDGVRIFLVRDGNIVDGYQGVATTPGGGPIHWCPTNHWFEGDSGGPYYDSTGVVLRYSAPRNLDRISVIVAAGQVTIFPHSTIRGAAAPPTPDPLPSLPPPTPCAANERVG